MIPFSERLQPAVVDGGFEMDGSWLWDGSVIQVDGTYHMFAARLTGFPGASFASDWPFRFHVVRATATSPTGPYRFEETVLEDRGPGTWDRMTINPRIRKQGDTYLLYYTGSTFDGPPASPDHPVAPGSERHASAVANQEIGLATAPAPEGPWTRSDEPILSSRTGCWDAMQLTNPAPYVRSDGSVLLLYKSTAGEADHNRESPLLIGAAGSDHYAGEYERLEDDPILDWYAEDPCIWREEDHFEMVAKDMTGDLCGERGAGIHAVSPDGTGWTLADPPLAYSRTVRWDDGRETRQAHVEQPQVFGADGSPTHLCTVTAEESPWSENARSRVIVFPLE